MSLQFNVSQLLKSDVGTSRTYTFALDEPMDLDGDVASGVEGTVKFMLTNFGILATVHAHADVHLTCARCLEPFQTPMDVAFEEEFQPVIDIQTGLPSRTPRSENASSISANHMLDLSNAIRENLLLGIEIIPVHSPDCRGLCPICGVNLNDDPDHSHPDENDNPFSVLQGLLAEADTER